MDTPRLLICTQWRLAGLHWVQSHVHATAYDASRFEHMID